MSDIYIILCYKILTSTSISISIFFLGEVYKFLLKNKPVLILIIDFIEFGNCNACLSHRTTVKDLCKYLWGLEEYTRREWVRPKYCKCTCSLLMLFMLFLLTSNHWIQCVISASFRKAQ